MGMKLRQAGSAERKRRMEMRPSGFAWVYWREAPPRKSNLNTSSGPVAPWDANGNEGTKVACQTKRPNGVISLRLKRPPKSKAPWFDDPGAFPIKQWLPDTGDAFVGRVVFAVGFVALPDRCRRWVGPADTESQTENSF